jgi:hypothetical protein
MQDDPTYLSPDIVGRIESDGRISGADIPTLTNYEIKVLRASKATAHKLVGMIVCAAPIEGGNVLLHFYKRLPKGVRLTDAIAFAKQQADEETSKPTQSRGAADPVSFAYSAIADLPVKSQPEHFLNALTDQGFHGVAAIATITNGKVGRIVFQKPEFAQNKDALKLAFQNALAGTDTQLDVKLLAQSMGARSAVIILPSIVNRGVALFGVDIDEVREKYLVDRLPFLASLNPDRPKAVKRKSYFMRSLFLTLFCGLTVYMILPAPIYVNNFATTRASEASIIALPFGAFLEEVNIRAGQIAKSGDVLVRLRAPQIEDVLSEQNIQQQLEAINAQEALETGNIAEFQLAEKRKEIAALREAQFSRRAQILNIISTNDLRVIWAQSQSDKGMYLAEGSPVITLQDSDGFDVTIDVKPADAARLSAGQTGTILFRGLGSEKHQLTLLSSPVQVEDPNTQIPIIQVKARIETKDQTDLITGLTGFAKIDTGSAPRIVGLSRPLREYLRVSLWKYLGITF